MASRLDPHTLLIFDLLNRQGRSFRSVCNTLQQHGVVIKPQSLQSWYQRRKRKILLRSKQMGGADLSAIRTGSNESQISANENTLNALTTIAVNMKTQGLKKQIERQESLLKLTPFTSATKKLPVPPKTQNFNKENK